MLSVVMLSVVMLSVVMLSVVMLSVVMLSVIMLNVVMLIVIVLSVVVPFATNAGEQNKLVGWFQVGLALPTNVGLYWTETLAYHNIGPECDLIQGACHSD
jgi:hypothetical protein